MGYALEGKDLLVRGGGRGGGGDGVASLINSLINLKHWYISTSYCHYSTVVTPATSIGIT